LAWPALGVAGMLLGPDIGTVSTSGRWGGALLYGTLWLFVVHLAKFAAEVLPDDPWSLAEKQAAVGIAFMALISFHVANLLFALPDLGLEADRLRNSATRPLWINLGMLFFAWTLIASTLRRQESGAVQLDERDLRITHGAARFADGSLASLIIGLVLVLVVLPDQSRTWLRPFIAANVLIALLIARSLVENIYTVWRYRRERA
jgi:hypothetical protein